MKYLQEKTLAQKVLKARLGFAPSLKDIIPLESSGRYGLCDYVMFRVEGNDNVVYKATFTGELTIEDTFYGNELVLK